MKSQLNKILNPVSTFLERYFSAVYLFGIAREAWLVNTLFGLSAFFVVLGAIVKFGLARKFKEKVYRRYINYAFRWTWIFAAIGFLLGFFAYEKAVYFGYRIWAYAWILGVTIWVAISLIKVLPQMKKDLKKHKTKKEKEKWFKK